MNKKGTILDVLVVLIVFAFFIGISSVVIFHFYNQFYASAYPQLNSSTEAATALDSMHNQEGLFDYIFLAVIMGLTITGYVLAFMIRESPVFFWLNLIVIIVMVVLSVAMSNAYNNVIDVDTSLNATAQSFPITNYYFNNLPLILTILVAGMLVVMYVMGTTGDNYA